MEKSEFLTLFGMKIKKLAKIQKSKNDATSEWVFKTNIPIRRSFFQKIKFLARLKAQMTKKCVFCDFLKKCDFWPKINITIMFLVKIPFWKCILLLTLSTLFKSYGTK